MKLRDLRAALRRPATARTAIAAAMVAIIAVANLLFMMNKRSCAADQGPPVAGGVGAIPPAAPANPTVTPVDRRPGPADSLLLVEEGHALPLVNVVVALRTGSGTDARKKDGLVNLAAETARRGAAGLTRAQLDARIAALGADLDVVTDADSVRFEGQVLSRNLEAYLGLIADVLLRPTFAADEFARTRREILASIDEARNNDRDLAQRFFTRNLYSDHPYGHPPEGTRAGLERVRREELVAHFRRHVVGPNVVFAASGDVTPVAFAEVVGRQFAKLPGGTAPGPNPLAIRNPVPPDGWRIQLVDKPERTQAQILFGQIGPRATEPEYLPMQIALTSFGGPGMTATLMDEVRTQRGLAYGAYMSLSERQGRGAITGWVFTATDKAVETLRLVLKLYLDLMEKGLTDQRIALAKTYLVGTEAAQLDDPERRLDARVTAEIVGLPPTFVDDLPAAIAAIAPDQVRAALKRFVRARDLAITVVSTAATLRPLLIESKIDPNAIDVVPFNKY